MKGTNTTKTTLSEVELVYRSKIKASERPTISCSADAYELLIANWDKEKIELVEQFRVMFLNRANKVLAIYLVSSGGVTGTVADPRLVFAAAIQINACSIILAHNHPSGALKASKADEELTHKMRQAGEFLDIKVLDHLIVHTEGYYSFADEGIV